MTTESDRKLAEVLGDNRETTEMTSYRSITSAYQPEVTSRRPEVVDDYRETPEITSYRTKTSAYQPEVTSSRLEVTRKWPEVVGTNSQTATGLLEKDAACLFICLLRAFVT